MIYFINKNKQKMRIYFPNCLSFNFEMAFLLFDFYNILVVKPNLTNKNEPIN
jgi:hypothetical protein